MRRPGPASFLLVIAALALGGNACSPAVRSAHRGHGGHSAKTRNLGTRDSSGLVIGEFGVDGAASVVDGDTVKVKGLDASIRLLAIDTEETFKHDSERAAYRAGFAQYLKALRGSSPRPAKGATPLGEEAKVFAQQFFDGVTAVRLERDHPGEVRDFYGRYLAYVLARKGGVWVNYNLEAVRAGMSPYFTKYGRSRRFHAEFSLAQREARQRQLGIWDPKKEHYDDYDERLVWWDARGAAIAAFEDEAGQRGDWIVLTRWNALLELERHVGKGEVVVLGSVGEIRQVNQGPTIVKLNRSRGSSLELVFFDPGVFQSSAIAKSAGEYIRVRGAATRYLDKHRGQERLQIVVSLPGQVSTSGVYVDSPELLPSESERE